MVVRPVIPMPAPEEMKSTLVRLQGCADDAFLKKHKLYKMGHSKLGKIKRPEFEAIITAFQEEGEVDAIGQFVSGECRYVCVAQRESHIGFPCKN